MVKAELYYGARQSARAATNGAKVDACVRPFLSLPFDDAAAEVGARARHHVEAQGAPSGLYDLQIAAIALANNLTLVTHNTSEFSRVPGLVLDDGEVP